MLAKILVNKGMSSWWNW